MNGLIDGTKCQSSERKGNLFRLLCIAHTTNGSCVMKRSLKYSDAKWKQYIEILKLYLCMEEWFQDSNNKVEVINARPQIAKVLRSLQQFFPRNTNTNGYNLPKMHRITKMWEYILAGNVGDMWATSRRHVEMSMNLGIFACGCRHQNSPDTRFLCRKLPTLTPHHLPKM
jgi:hypothetical protein